MFCSTMSNSNVGRPYLLDSLPDQHLEFGRQASAGLVQDQNRRVDHQAARQSQHGALAPAQGAGPAGELHVEVGKEQEQLLDPLANAGLANCSRPCPDSPAR